ncbi:MAG: OsmC family protein [Pseudomonadota bacterium]
MEQRDAPGAAGSVEKSSMGVLEASARVEAGDKFQMIGRVGEHTVVMDLSPERGGENVGPTPPEVMVLSLAGCVLNMTRALATGQGLDPAGLAVEASGRIDLDKAFGLPTENRAGFLGLTVKVRPGAAWSEEGRRQVQKLLEERCPLCDSLEKATPLELVFL